MANVLLYNLSGTEKGKKIKFVCMKLGISGLEIEPGEYLHPIGYLAGLEGFSPAESFSGDGFGDEMLVMNGFTNSQIELFLAAMRQARIPSVALKAVVTAHNAGWSSIELHRELSLEHAAMQGMSSRKAGKNRIHKDEPEK